MKPHPSTKTNQDKTADAAELHQLTEAAWRESEERFRRIFEEGPVGMVTLASDFRFTRANAAFCNMLGYTERELTALTLKDVTHPEHVAPDLKMVQKVIDGNLPVYRTQKRYVRKDGGGIWGAVTATSVRDLEGRFLCIVAMIEDITDRKRAEERVAVFSELGRSLNATSTREEAAKVIMDAADALFGWDACSVVLYETERDEAVDVLMMDTIGGKRVDVSLPNSDTKLTEFSRKVVTEGAQLVLRGSPQTVAPRLQPFGDNSRPSASLMFVPVHHGAKVVGIMSIQSYTPSAYDQAELNTFQALADHCSGALERIRVEREQTMLSDVIRASLNEIYLFDAATLRFRFANDGALANLGYPLEQMRRLTLMEVKPEFNPEVFAQLVEPLRRGEKAMQVFQSVQRRADGSRYPVEVHLQFFDHGGDPVFLAVVQDITERKRADERLRRQAALLDAATDAIYVRALDHTVTYWNEGAERLYGWTCGEALGRKINELGSTDHAAFAAAHSALLEQGSWSGELKKADKTGEERVFFCRWTLLRDEQGRPMEVLAINTDITEQKQMEANFLRAQRQESIGALAGGIAHDLNNILAPVLMTAALLRETVSDPESRAMVDIVESCAQRGAGIIKQLLTFALGEPGARVPLPARHLLGEMDKIICETFPRNIQPSVSAPKDLWPVMGDATQIYQALMNLCVNARDAMPEGGRLTLTAENRTLDEAFAAGTPDAKPGAYVCVGVTDTGAGISPRNLDRIFDPFFTTKEIGQGTGLGLPTVLGIVRGHGGFVRVNSRVGQGTTFELYLPASPAAQVAPSTQRACSPPRGAGEFVLVVDDEAAVRSIVQRTLRQQGYEVLAASEGAQALALFTERRAEVKAVITDMMMPGMDGPALVQSLRRFDARVPILAMTGLAERAGVKGLESLDVAAVLTKPFAAGDLLNAVHRALAPAADQPLAS
jgi:PAS domain S-box-containing protein